MKYYAVASINGKIVNKIYKDWDECKKDINGKNTVFKSFKDLNSAYEYLGTKPDRKCNDKDKIVYYTDGSFVNEKIGWAFVCVKNNNCITKMSNVVNCKNHSRNVTGELTAVINAVRHAITNDYEDIKICYDYEGVGKWISGEWKTKTTETVRYKELIERYSRIINISFEKVPAHSGVHWNVEADRIAKLGATL